MGVFKIFIIVFTLLFPVSLLAKDKGVAKVLVAKGSAFNVDTKKKLKKGQWIQEGTKILTKSRSFVKLLFIDKSKMSLGPNSQMVVNKFPKKKAGIITLMKGQLRSQVTKNYMDMDKSKSKLFIKTKTAAMGVRGTDFQVNYNPRNRNTSLITFEGAVALGAIKNVKRRFNHNNLEKIVSSPTSVMVRQGQYSGIVPKLNSKPSSPVKVNTKQLKSLEKNDGSIFGDNDKSKKEKKTAVRSIIPPGAGGEEFSGASKEEVISNIAQADPNAVKEIKQEIAIAKPQEQDAGLDIPEQKAPVVIVDTKTGFPIQAPKGAPLDMNGEPVFEESIVKIDPKTGELDFGDKELTDDGTMKAKPKPARTIASTNPDGSPADTPELPPVEDKPLEPVIIIGTTPDAPTIDPIQIEPTPTFDSTITKKLLDDRTTSIQDTQEDQTTTVIQKRSRVKLRFNVQD